jgi:carbon monoxide dehydrogenase subunit G
MTVFSTRNVSSSTVPAPSSSIWQLVTDPGTLADLTPMVRGIEASGTHWTWTLHGIEALGLKVEPVFTERMEFTTERQIVFSHDPPGPGRELAGLEGVYDLTPVANGATDLAVDLTLSIDVPLPGLSRRAVEGVLKSMMRTTGRVFATNLYERLGLDPSAVDIRELDRR